MRLGLGIGVNRKTPISQYQFINAQASTYFAALEVAGFTEAQSLSLYSLSFDAIKEGIDNYFIANNSGGVDINLVVDYLIIGGTAATHAINAINPGTLDGIFVGSPTHAATGVTANGTTQYMKTGLIPDMRMSLNDTHLGVYSRTDTNANLQVGVQVSTTERFRMNLRNVSDNIVSDHYRFNFGGRITTTNTDSLGHHVSTRVANNDHRIVKDGAQIGSTNTDTTVGNIPTVQEIYMFGALNNNGTPVFSDGEWTGGQAGDGLTVAEISDNYTAKQALETLLGRQV